VPQTYTAIRDNIESRLQDGGNSVHTTAELDLLIEDALRDMAQYIPHNVLVLYAVETRTGSATATSAGYLVDTGETQFVVANDIGKVIHNTTDNTWAIVVTDGSNSTSTLKLSRDIMASGEQYEMFNPGCTANNQINIGDVQDHLWVEKVCFPIGVEREIDHIRGDILTIGISYDPDDTKDANAVKIVEVYFAKRHKLTQLTDTTGAVNNGAGYSEGATSMAMDGLQSTGTVEEDQEFTVAGLQEVYTVTADASISSNAATVTFYPGLEGDVADDAVVTFVDSTLKRQHESLLVEYVTARAEIDKGAKMLLQADAAITSVASAATALGLVAAKVLRQVTDIASGRTEAAKVAALINSAATEIGLINAQVDLAVTAVASGKTATDKVDAIISSAATEIGRINAEVNRAVTAVANAKSAADLMAAVILEANTEVDKMAAEVALANTALDSSNTVTNTVTKGGPNVPSQYQGEAAQRLNTARGYMGVAQGYLQQTQSNAASVSAFISSATGSINAGGGFLATARGYMEQAAADERAAATYFNLAAADLASARGFFTVAQGYLAQAAADESITRTYIGLGAAELQGSMGSINEAAGYIRKSGAELSITRASREYRIYGEAKLAKVIDRLMSITEPSIAKTLPRTKGVGTSVWVS